MRISYTRFDNNSVQFPPKHQQPILLPDLDTLDSEKLKALVIEKHTLVVEKEAELASQQDEIQRLKLFIAKLQRMQFGPSSEKLARHIDQLELRLEDLESNKTATTKPSAAAVLSTSVSSLFFRWRCGFQGLGDLSTSGGMQAFTTF